MSCTKCRLHETCHTVQVASRGSDHPTVMFVGEAPGQEEDQKGKCFVGPAGQLLEQAIREYGLTPAYITNVVRCNPPGNRDPRVDEIAACFPYLVEEIKRLRPKIIVTLGNVPLKALTGKHGVMSFSGSVVKEVGGIKVFSLMHPSFILRYPGNLPKFEMHLRELQRVMNGEKKEQAVQVLDVKPKEAFELLRDNKLTAFDYETSGLFKGEGGRVRAVGFSTGADTFVVNAEANKDLPKLMSWFLKSKIPKVAYNSAFETRWSLEEFGHAPNNLVHDPMLLHYLLDENSSRDLESVASQYLTADRWGIEGLMREKGWDFATIPYENLVLYCGLDCFHTLKLARVLNDYALANGVSENLYEELLQLARFCAEIEIAGIKLDKKWAAKADKEYEINQARLARKLNVMEVVTGYVKQKRLKDKRFEFNPGSSMQLRDIVFGKLGLHSDKRTKKGGLQSTDQDVMEKLKDQHPFIPAYLDWKAITTRRNNFTIKFPSFCDKNDLIHPHYNPIGTVTGRLSASEPPAHTFPRPDEDEDEKNMAKIRGMVIPRYPGGKIISSDYSQLELRILASEADEDALLEAFAKGKDPHGQTAAEMFGKGYTKADRAIAKNINFGTVYGIQADSLSKKFNVPYETAEGWLARHRKTFPKIYIWMEKQHDFVRKNGWIKSRSGLVRHLPEVPKLLQIPNPDRKTRWLLARLLRQAGNFPIQNAGAYINNIACLKVAARINSAGVGCLFLPIHDSILVDVPPKREKAVSAQIRAIMEGEMQKVCTWLKVQLKIDQTISARWGN